jgi:anaphase-promoting complex subunit 1
LRTESQEVADILTIPDTVMALNRIPPNFLLLRTLSRNLILWGRIAPTREWVDAQLPIYIVKALDERAQGKSIDDAIELAYYNIVAGCCFAIALKYAGTAREEPYMFLINYYDTFSRMAYTNGMTNTSLSASASLTFAGTQSQPTIIRSSDMRSAMD